MRELKKPKNNSLTKLVLNSQVKLSDQVSDGALLGKVDEFDELTSDYTAKKAKLVSE